MDVRRLWREGLAASVRAKSRVEQDRRGTYRGGSSGVVLPDGMVTGKCHRASLARSLGYEETHADSKQLMFKAGERNEDSWLDFLSQSSFVTEEGGTIVKMDHAVEFKTKAGTPITGSPDTVFYDRDGKAVHGLEHKNISSLWTAKTVLAEGTPKIAHIIQAALYMHGLDVPTYDLIYTNSMNFSGPDWATKFFPKPGEHLSECVEFTYYNLQADGMYKSGPQKGKTKWKKSKVNVPSYDTDLPFAELKKKYPEIKKGELKHLKPFFVIYHLTLDEDGVVYYRLEGTEEEVATPVDIPSIFRYYDYLDEMQRDKKLGLRPIEISPIGEIKSFSPCDYCPLAPICDTYEKSYDKWVAEVKKQIKD